jgi:thioesterase domain-containing protein
MAQQVTSAGEDVAFVGIINCEVPRFPSSLTGRLLVRAQRLRHQVGEARKEGHGLVGYVSRKLAARRQARAHERELAAAAEQVKASGFQRDADAHNRVLLQRTAEVFDRYVPRPYPGSISLFISDEEAYLGVSAELDARRQWVHFAAQYEIRMFPGGHDSVLDRNDAGAFAATLKVALEDALRSYAAKRDVG